MARNVMNTLSRSYCDVERDISGRLNGYTVIYNSTDVFNRMVECKYFYVDGYCDYLRSEGFGAGSMASDRVRACKKKNKGVSDPWLQKRFYSIDKGFFSLKELFGEKNYPNGTDQTRLKSIHNKLKGVSTYEKPSVLRWCSARVCGCMGAMNCSMRKYSTMTKDEHEDLLCYLKFNALEHEYSKLFYATMGS